MAQYQSHAQTSGRPHSHATLLLRCGQCHRLVTSSTETAPPFTSGGMPTTFLDKRYQSQAQTSHRTHSHWARKKGYQVILESQAQTSSRPHSHQLAINHCKRAIETQSP